MRMRNTYVEMLVCDARAHCMLISEMSEHAVQDRGTVQFMDEFIETSHDTQRVRVELAAVHVSDVNAVEERPRRRVLSEHAAMSETSCTSGVRNVVSPVVSETSCHQRCQKPRVTSSVRNIVSPVVTAY